MPGYVGTSIVANTALAYPENRVSKQRMDAFRNEAPVSADQAADIILNGVREGRWRILIGEDARWLDEEVRRDPEVVYEEAFYARQRKAAIDRGQTPRAHARAKSKANM
jgi:hypothetical protein